MISSGGVGVHSDLPKKESRFKLNLEAVIEYQNKNLDDPRENFTAKTPKEKEYKYWSQIGRNSQLEGRINQ